MTKARFEARAALAMNSCFCRSCTRSFTPKRKDQCYCTKFCAKKATRNAARGAREVANSPAARRTHECRKGRVKGLSHALYETPPQYRADFMQRLIREAHGNAELRKLLANREMLRCWSRLRGDPNAGSGGMGRLHIAHVLDHFCQEVYGQRSYEVLSPSAELPSPEDLIFPAEYFGPDSPPTYEDGSRKMRPCPWKTWKAERQKSLHHNKGVHIDPDGVLTALSPRTAESTSSGLDPLTEDKKAA